jgi:hypothetical protein
MRGVLVTLADKCGFVAFTAATVEEALDFIQARSRSM